MIKLFGDAWLGKVTTILQEFYPEHSFMFIPERTIAPGQDVPSDGATAIIVSAGLNQLDQIPNAIIVPRALIDGLSSVEVFGNKLVGAEYLPEQLSERERKRIFGLIAKGEYDFNCAERLESSLTRFAEQGEIGRKLAAFVTANHRETQLVSGLDRPDPVLTVEAARLVADALGLNGSRINRKELWRTDQVAYRVATRALLPQDAAQLGIRYPLDSRWLDALGRIFSLAYDNEGKRRPPVFEASSELIARQNWLQQRVSGPTDSPLAELFRLQKAQDKAGIMAELDRLAAQIDHFPKPRVDDIRMAILRWLPDAGKADYAIDLVLKSKAKLGPLVLRKLANTAALHLDAVAIAALQERIATRRDIPDEIKAKIARAQAVKLKKSRVAASFWSET